MDLRRFGRGVRALRHRRSLRQDDVAAAARVSRSQVGRIERGESGSIGVATLDRVAAAVGGTTDLVLRWRGEALDRLLDEAHAELVEAIVRLLRGAGWDVLVEVSFNVFGERGSIDVLGWHPNRRALVVIEVKSVAADHQAMLHGLDRKTRLAPGIARDRGWEPRVVGRLLVVADTRTNRRRIGTHAAMFEAAVPATGWAVKRWLDDPATHGFAGRLFLSGGRETAARGRSRHRVRSRGHAPSGTGDDGAATNPVGDRSSEDH